MISWLRRLYLQHFDLHDKAWAPTGIRPMTEWRYDEAKAVASARKARRRSPTGKLLPKPRPHIAEIVPMRRAK